MVEKPNNLIAEVTRWLVRDSDPHWRVLEDWLERTPRTEVVAVLHEILRRAEKESFVNFVLSAFSLGCFLFAFISLYSALATRNHTPVPYWIFYSPFGPLIWDIAQKWKKRNRVRDEAIWLLARLGDPEVTRCLAPQWEYVAPPKAQNSRQRRVANALTELATLATGKRNVEESANLLRPLLDRFLDAHPRAVYESDADMLLAAVRCLAKNGTPVDHSLLHRLAALPRTPDENLTLLTEAARLSLEPPAPVVLSPTQPHRTSEPDASVVIINQR